MAVFEDVRNFYPEPHDYVVTPMRVETAFRGISTDTALVELRPAGCCSVVELEHALDWSNPLTSPGGVSIRISGPGYFADTVTDGDGTFLAAGVPDGPMTIAPVLSEN